LTPKAARAAWGGVAVALLALAAARAPAAEPSPPSNQDCLACHEDPTLQRSDGRPLRPALERFPSSVHGQAGVSCVDCHADLVRTTEFPHAERLAPAQCASCHAGAVEEYGQGVHAQARLARPGSPAANCTDCHGTHDILPSRDRAARTYHLNLPATCGACHGNPETIARGGIRIGNVLSAYQDSIHGRALAKSGLTVAPNCNSCHGHHDIRRASDPKSPVAHASVPVTCGRCHAGIQAAYATSVHAQAAATGGGAVCSDCHSAHGIQAAGVPGWRLEVIKECGTCHAQSVRTYRDGFHGQATALGFVRMAACVDCHAAHEIRRVSDPASRVNAANRVATCARCHPGANQRFVQYDPHADPHDRNRNRPVYYTALFMKTLLAGVFGFFCVHTALWFPRSFRERRRARTHGQPR
jgi:nitrate/TMAO reductase-like tetraheme cytochrome c subunit